MAEASEMVAKMASSMGRMGPPDPLAMLAPLRACKDVFPSVLPTPCPPSPHQALTQAEPRVHR